MGQRDPFSDRWRARFARYALLHGDDAGVAGWSRSGLSARFRFFERNRSERTSGGTWLDVGCGAGTYARHLAQGGARVIGIDYSFPSIVHARAREAEGVSWLVGDARRLPLRDKSADGVLCFGLTQAVGASGPLVEELSRVVSPGGQIWIDGLNGWCVVHVLERVWARMQRRRTNVRYESPWRLRTLVQEAGLGHVRLLWLPIVPGRFPRLQRLLEHPMTVWVLHAVPLLGALVSHSMVVVGEPKAR